MLSLKIVTLEQVMQKAYSTYTKSPRLWTMVVPKKKKEQKDTTGA
jgi:hypothetical protein